MLEKHSVQEAPSPPHGTIEMACFFVSFFGSQDFVTQLFVCSVPLFLFRRTSYSSVTQSRSYLPDEVGALLWVSQYKPSMSTCIPIYVGAEEVCIDKSFIAIERIYL